MRCDSVGIIKPELTGYKCQYSGEVITTDDEVYEVDAREYVKKEYMRAWVIDNSVDDLIINEYGTAKEGYELLWKKE